MKGWLDQNGEAHEAVYDVAGEPGNGASVDLDTCEPQGTGFASLCTVWEDPEFDAGERAFYYARVVDNPTCRWNQQFCADRFGKLSGACDAGLPQADDVALCCDSTSRPPCVVYRRLADRAAEGVNCGDPTIGRPPRLRAARRTTRNPEQSTRLDLTDWSRRR